MSCNNVGPLNYLLHIFVIYRSEVVFQAVTMVGVGKVTKIGEQPISGRKIMVSRIAVRTISGPVP
jgi:hypothetical protein